MGVFHTSILTRKNLHLPELMTRAQSPDKNTFSQKNTFDYTEGLDKLKQIII